MYVCTYVLYVNYTGIEEGRVAILVSASALNGKGSLDLRLYNRCTQ
jgi:hypothetical protein